MASFYGSMRVLTSRSLVRRSFEPRHSLRQAQPTILRLNQQNTGRSYAADSLSQVEAPEHLSEGERKVFDMIKEGLEPISLEVQDISGGCGSMYALEIVSEKFKGLPVIKQHRMVNQVLGDEMKKWHGVQLKTRVP